MPHPFATDFGLGHFDTAAVADDAAETDPFVFSAVALPVLDRAEYPLAEKTITLRFEGAVVDRFRLGNLAIRPGKNRLR